jgi:ketosteroid isomerase-like protein
MIFVATFSSLWEFMPRMNRFLACFAAVLLTSCVTAAQNPPSGPATVQPAVTTTASPEVVQFQKIEDAWSNAVSQRDQYGLELVLSPLFLDVSANGDITTLNQQVAQLISSDDKSLSLTQRVITVRMLGDTAVANGTYTLRHRVNSAEVDEKGVFTHVFERVHGNWMCVNSQRTSVKEGSGGSKEKKPSNAELPFHIPLFSH